MLGLATYGGRINTVAPDATAFCRDLFRATGGVPVPGDASDGAFINHPDTDLRDATRNTFGVAWHTLYYRDNCPRLQRAKRRWDPRNVFRHALSIDGNG